jgi:hypothetical protein
MDMPANKSMDGLRIRVEELKKKKDEGSYSAQEGFQLYGSYIYKG